jgi:nucleoside-diphosphate-sugar epimerase
MNARKTGFERVLLLGATGFIGNAILRTLLDAGKFEVCAVQHKRPIAIAHPNLTVVEKKIGNLDLKQINPDIIIHAARNRTGKFGSIGRLLMAIKGKKENERLLQQCHAMNTPPRIIYLSGSLMYGSHKDNLIDESFALQPVSFARQYVKAEMPFVHQLETHNSLRLTMIRLPWVIGAGSWFKWNYQHWITKNKTVPLYGEGHNIMTFIDVNAIGPAILVTLKNHFTGVLNLFHPEHLSQKDWADIVAEVAGVPAVQLTNEQMQRLPAAVVSAFETDIRLGSKFPDLQKQLAPLHKPLHAIVSKHLFPGEHE